ncbi:sulfite exporter TauE/SafE family protein [Tessaracoccus caeni]|uniref:sulfite exporter TauE/SafE family protein n=1 Tax=Tessaracoccus caeni TaxID=3031239 RepID=UPI0023DA8464|nr:TSUP family transporter [Tessaracoccus caeni]MDF1490395.1 TSUP family transporter [Tessaracoccus caeni]
MLFAPLLADWLPVEVPTLVMLLLAAAVAGWVDAVVGGGGLIQLPALVIGLPKEIATPVVLGTNKMSSFAGTLLATGVYLRKLRVQAVVLVPLILGAFAGSGGGASVSRYLPREVLEPIVLVAVIAVGIYTVRRPSLGLEHAPRRQGPLTTAWQSSAIGLVVGFYDGMLGPGTGSFFVILIVAVLGYGFLQASVHAKIANLATNVAAILVYGVHGELLLALGLMMATANIAGGFFGARMAVKNGNAFVRRVFLVVMGILVLKLAWDVVGSLLASY